MNRRHFALASAGLLGAAALRAQARPIAIELGKGLTLHHVAATPESFLGKSALKLMEPDGAESTGEDKLAIVEGLSFSKGVIELEIASRPRVGAGQGARGFAGLAFRIAGDASKFECFYLRPTNGRADDQERRNHSVQYISFPDHPWHKLRSESPSKYETYADVQPGVWMPVRIEVEGVQARLFVLGAGQPTLLVNDLKLGDTRGSIGLWIGPGTEAWFRDLKVTS